MPAPHHLFFLQAGCPSCHPTNSVKGLKAESLVENYWFNRQMNRDSHMHRVEAVGQIALDIAVRALQQVQRQNWVSLHVFTAALRQSVARRWQLNKLHNVELSTIRHTERQLCKQPTTTIHVSFLPGFLSSLFSVARCLAPAPLKLRPYGAIQIRLLLLYF